jgi:hypothetical protein
MYSVLNKQHTDTQFQLQINFAISITCSCVTPHSKIKLKRKNKTEPFLQSCYLVRSPPNSFDTCPVSCPSSLNLTLQSEFLTHINITLGVAFVVLTAVLLKIQDFFDVTLCLFVNSPKNFGEMWCLQDADMEVTFQTTKCHPQVDPTNTTISHRM